MDRGISSFLMTSSRTMKSSLLAMIIKLLVALSAVILTAAETSAVFWPFAPLALAVGTS